MAKELSQILSFYERLAQANPKFKGMVVQLEGAVNLNETLGGPSSIYEPILSSKESKTREWETKLVDFFSKHVSNGSYLPERKLEIAKLFNAEFAEDLTDDTLIADLLIPNSDPRWTADQIHVADKAKQIDPGLKVFYTRWINAVTRVARFRHELNEEQITVGWFRNSIDGELKYPGDSGIGKSGIAFMRTALAPKSTEVS